MTTTLTRYTQQLPLRSQEIFKVLETRMAKDIPDVELFELLRTALSYAYANAGYKIPDPQEVGFMVKEIHMEVKTSFPTMREGEFLIAAKRGVLKEYGDFMGLSVSSFIEFFRRYNINNDRMNALREFNRAPEEPYIPIQSEVFYMSKNNALKSFEDFKAGRQLFLPSIIYDFLDGLGLVRISTEKKKELFEQAKKELLKEAQSVAFTGVDSIKQSMIKSYIEEIESGKGIETIKTKAKALALNFYFECAEEVYLDLSEAIGEYKVHQI